MAAIWVLDLGLCGWEAWLAARLGPVLELSLYQIEDDGGRNGTAMVYLASIHILHRCSDGGRNGWCYGLISDLYTALDWNGRRRIGEGWPLAGEYN
jgi:hypothetical protein